VALAVAAAGCGGGGSEAPSGDELARLARPPIVPAIASRRIYFVLTDRYANGDPSNDRGGLEGTREATGFDPTDPGYYHGGDLRGLTAGLRRIKDLGVNAIWVTPVVKQKPVQNGSAAYHGYWGLDFTHVDPHLGTDRDFARFVATAHRLGLEVYLDVVVNHTADVIFLGSGYSDAPYQDCRGRVFDPRQVRRREDVPVPEARRHAARAAPARRGRAREAPGVDERRDGLPQPRRHRLRVV
jgi:hypothetical protein